MRQRVDRTILTQLTDRRTEEKRGTSTAEYLGHFTVSVYFHFSIPLRPPLTIPKLVQGETHSSSKTLSHLITDNFAQAQNIDLTSIYPRVDVVSYLYWVLGVNGISEEKERKMQQWLLRISVAWTI